MKRSREITTVKNKNQNGKDNYSVDSKGNYKETFIM